MEYSAQVILTTFTIPIWSFYVLFHAWTLQSLFIVIALNFPNVSVFVSCRRNAVIQVGKNVRVVKGRQHSCFRINYSCKLCKSGRRINSVTLFHIYTFLPFSLSGRKQNRGNPLHVYGCPGFGCSGPCKKNNCIIILLELSTERDNDNTISHKEMSHKTLLWFTAPSTRQTDVRLLDEKMLVYLFASLKGDYTESSTYKTAQRCFKTDLYSGWDVVDDLYSAAVRVSGQRLRYTVDFHLALGLGAGLLSVDCLARGALQTSVL